MRNLSVSVVSSIVFALVAGTASADLVTVQCTGVGAGRTVSVTHMGAAQSVFAGQIQLNLTNSTSGAYNGVWKSFCTELSQHIIVGGAAQVYEVLPVAQVPVPGPGMGQARADAISRMYAFASTQQFGTNADYAAAFQIAVWEVSNDYDGLATSLSMSSGQFHGASIAAPIMTHVTALLGAAADQSGALASIIGIGNSSFQDQLLDPASAIPTPGAVAMLGLAGLIGQRRRRR